MIIPARCPLGIARWFRLDEADLITSRTLGRNRLVRANTDHPAAPALTQLLQVTVGPKAVVAEAFTIPGAGTVIIFGAWAARCTGQAGPSPHDIDVLVVGKVDRADVYEAADRAQARFGLAVNPVVGSVEQWEGPADPLVAQIRASAFVVVSGTDERWSRDPLKAWRCRGRSSPHGRRPAETHGSGGQRPTAAGEGGRHAGSGADGDRARPRLRGH